MKTILAFFAAAAVALTASPTFAQQAPGQLLVSYSDLDLTSASGVRRLDRRIRSAVEEVCGEVTSFNPAGRNIIRQCREETLSVARTQRDQVIAEAAQDGQVQLASQR